MTKVTSVRRANRQANACAVFFSSEILMSSAYVSELFQPEAWRDVSTFSRHADNFIALVLQEYVVGSDASVSIRGQIVIICVADEKCRILHSVETSDAFPDQDVVNVRNRSESAFNIIFVCFRCLKLQSERMHNPDISFLCLYYII